MSGWVISPTELRTLQGNRSHQDPGILILQKCDEHFVRERPAVAPLPVGLDFRNLQLPLGLELLQNFAHVLAEIRCAIVRIQLDLVDGNLPSALEFCQQIRDEWRGGRRIKE